jgi:hypothetical protein
MCYESQSDLQLSGSLQKCVFCEINIRAIREWQLDSISSATNPMLEPALWATRQQADPLLD